MLLGCQGFVVCLLVAWIMQLQRLCSQWCVPYHPLQSFETTKVQKPGMGVSWNTDGGLLNRLAARKSESATLEVKLIRVLLDSVIITSTDSLHSLPASNDSDWSLRQYKYIEVGLKFIPSTRASFQWIGLRNHLFSTVQP